MKILKYVISEIAALKRKQETAEFANLPRLRKSLDLSNNDMESECLISEHTSRIETSPEKRSHTNKSKSDRWGLSVSLNPVKENLELPLKLTSRKGRSPKRKKNLKLQRYFENSRESSEKPSEEIHHHKQNGGRK